MIEGVLRRSGLVQLVIVAPIVEEFVKYIQERAGTELRIEVARGEELLTFAVVPAEVEGKGRITSSSAPTAGWGWAISWAIRHPGRARTPRA